MGTKKCRETQKAIRFFKERGIIIQFRDLIEKGLSEGELENIKPNIKPEELIDTESRRYKQRGMSYMVFDIEEELLKDPLLLKTPLVRNGNKSTAGYKPETWLEWIKSS